MSFGSCSFYFFQQFALIIALNYCVLKCLTWFSSILLENNISFTNIMHKYVLEIFKYTNILSCLSEIFPKVGSVNRLMF